MSVPLSNRDIRAISTLSRRVEYLVRKINERNLPHE